MSHVSGFKIKTSVHPHVFGPLGLSLRSVRIENENWKSATITYSAVLHVLHTHGHKHHNHSQRSSGACTYAEARKGREGRPALERRGGLLVLLVTAGLLRALRVAVLGVDCLLG